MRVALLSNINLNPVVRLLKDSFEVFETEGYGNELGMLLNQHSSVYAFDPDYIFLIEDIAELTGHSLGMQQIQAAVEKWFCILESVILPEKIYYVSDVYYFSPDFETVWDKGIKLEIEKVWEDRLRACVDAHDNVRVFRYRRMIEGEGENNSFSLKMWYMGKILHSMNILKEISEEIKRQILISGRVPKKVLLLDLDNTLWGGLAGENDVTPVILSEDKSGAAYKSFQRMLFWMKEQGVVLGIVSKNNENDALDIIRNHPHMVLREADFSIYRINWKPKHENITEIAKELNIGLDSIVFLDDNPAERKLVRDFLPAVTVPEFDAVPENLTAALTQIYHSYFEKTVITAEDKNKTEQYQANKLRLEMREKAVDFDSYLENLEIRLTRVAPAKNKARWLQLMNKTNQFNLTTMRFSEENIESILEDEKKEVFLYSVQDCFGDNGIVVAAILDYTDEPTIIEFTMSCRVMGREIENAVIEEIEKSVKSKGYKSVVGVYRPTEKNKPVASLYASLGYDRTEVLDDGTERYRLALDVENIFRKYKLRIQEDTSL